MFVFNDSGWLWIGNYWFVHWKTQVDNHLIGSSSKSFRLAAHWATVCISVRFSNNSEGSVELGRLFHIDWCRKTFKERLVIDLSSFWEGSNFVLIVTHCAAVFVCRVLWRLVAPHVRLNVYRGDLIAAVYEPLGSWHAWNSDCSAAFVSVGPRKDWLKRYVHL